ncbi:uncharacterized protein LOC131145875 [Malania oleifera]|uniref:uncharacterized protein LOC131145875 n=1 Tax=Malania oleifera TaxID=397392 RepID=UPI0025AEAD44|nr:uncharacterized protein LOC131145875 [Malania oleifera]
MGAVPSAEMERQRREAEYDKQEMAQQMQMMEMENTKLRSEYLYSKSILSSSSSSSSPSSTSSSKKVADYIVKLFAIDPDGQKREVLGLAGHTLLRALSNHGLIDPTSHRLEDIDACSAECEVNIAQEWLEKLPPPSYDEQYVLKRNSRSRVLNKHSRLLFL